MDRNRRDFLKRAGLVTTWLGVSVLLQACSDDDNPGQPAAGDEAGSISANHGHAVVITAAQIQAGNAVTLTLSGGGHTHAVSLTAPQVSAIGGGTQVSATTTDSGGHTHQVTFN